MKLSEMPSLEDSAEAMEVMAELVMFEQSNPESTEQHRLMLIGNYIIACSLSTEDPSLENIRENFVNGLVTAGANRGAVEQAGNLMATIRAARYFFSLSYLPSDVKGNGIKRTKKGVWLDEAEFVRSIISLKN